MKKNRPKFRWVEAAEFADYMDTLVNASVRLHSLLIAAILAADGIAVAIHGTTDENSPFLLSLGWDGQAPAFEMRSEAAEDIARHCQAVGDTVTARWLRSEREGRIFLVARESTFLLNLTEEGLSLEPGSLDHEWMR